MARANTNQVRRNGTGFHGYMFMVRDGKIERRLCTILGDKAYVHSLRMQRSGQRTAQIVSPHVLFRTEAAAQGGEDIDIFVCHDTEYKKLRGRKLDNGGYASVNGDGDLSRVWGEVFTVERAALDYCLARAAKDVHESQIIQRGLQQRLKEINARENAKDRAAARKVARKLRRRSR